MGTGHYPGAVRTEKQKRRVPGVMAPGMALGLVHGVSGEVAGGFKLTTARERTAPGMWWVMVVSGE